MTTRPLPLNDFLVVDLTAHRAGPTAVRQLADWGARVIRKEDLHETDYTPWEGHQVSAWPSMTILRGKVVVDGSQFHGSTSDGQFLPRKIPEDIRARPAV